MPDNSGIQLSDNQLSDEQSRSVAAVVREELARRRISRQYLAELAKISISTLEKALSGRRPFTLATTIRLEQALGVSLRKANAEPRSLRRSRSPWRPASSASIRGRRCPSSRGTT